MSSNLRTVAQIPARIKYLVAVASTDDGGDTNLLSDSCRIFTCPKGTFSESLISDASLPSVGAEDLNAGDLFKDLGRQVTIYDADTKLHLVTYRQVQPVDGAGSEGVAAGDYETATYVRVWAASGQGVLVARTGPGAH